mmetsp:Transcript_50040/g.117625  ORF Transcript_50040/g.117625 Transcript_50040/m.117625 type:complete len:107 (+) Transcript_50040:550-870(+)
MFSGLLTYLFLGLNMDFLGAVVAIFGLYPSDAMRNPFILSSSPRDLWGQRWNLIIHGILKRSYFVPLAKSGYPQFGVLAAFTMSAVFHESALSYTTKSPATGTCGP